MIEIRSINNQTQATFYAESQETEKIGNRAGKSKERGQLVVDGYSQAVEFFTRSVDGEEYADIWNLFAERGMPVVNELWMDEQGKIYMPNLTADGSGLYGKALEQALNEVPRKAADRVFVRTWQTQKEQIKTAVSRLVDYSTDQGLLLPLDDPFDLHVYPDGSWDLLCLDLEYGGTLEDLLERKNRMTTNTTRFPLSEKFGGRTIDQLLPTEVTELVRQVNEKVAKTALVILDSLAKKLA